MPEHYSLTIRSRVIDFHIYVPVPGSEAKVRSLERFFARMPDVHLALVCPIFIMLHKPGGRDGGGTWRPGEVRSMVMGAAHSRNSLVPDADIETYVTSRGLGMVGISRDRRERPLGRLPGTVFHEVGHCVDAVGLVPHGATEADFPGMHTRNCGAGNLLGRRAVEAYARAIYRPGQIAHAVPAGGDPAVYNAQLLSTLRRSPAFHAVPPHWPTP
jgi:hypothetical protein